MGDESARDGDGGKETGGPPLALELLVHGVGGTTPERMLGDPRTVRLAGDDTAGVYRRTDDAEAETAPGRRSGPVPEAYCWCNLTSGNGARALWLLLLPFMVVNVAHWMRPPGGRPALGRVYDLLLRLLALSLTVLLVAAACEVALDLVAWQCAGDAACAGAKSWLGFADAARGGWWSEPGRRLALAALLPLSLTGLLWWLSRRTWTAYESHRPLPRGESGPADETVTPLSRPGFWYGRRLVARLRAAHTAAALLTVAAALVIPALGHDRARSGALLTGVGHALLVSVAILGAATTVVVSHGGRDGAEPDDTSDRVPNRALLGCSLGVAAASVFYAAGHREGWVSSGGLPGDVVFSVLTLAQGALIASLALTAALTHGSGPPGRPGATRPSGPAGEAGTVTGAPAGRVVLRGIGGPAVALLACTLGGVLTGGVTQRVADWLDSGATPGDGPLAGPPVLLSWQASAIPLLLVVGAGIAVVAGWRLLRTRRSLLEEVGRAYPDEKQGKARTRGIAGAVARAGLTDSAPVLIGTVSAAAFLLGACAVAGAWTFAVVPGEAADGSPAALAAAADTAQALGSWLVGAGVVAMVTLGRRAYRDASTRRIIGIVWDVGTFWPRAAHPFAPPCYAERAVPDLTWRMATWTRRTGGRIVLSGHSQGSVLAAAAIWQLDPVTRHRVALLTYGSPLERLYGRWFPAYFGPGRLRELNGQVRAWRNLWRSTDPIGGPVRVSAGGGPAVDHGPLKDPVAYGRTAEHPLPTPILGHADYPSDPGFATERAALLSRVAREEAGEVPVQRRSGRSSG